MKRIVILGLVVVIGIAAFLAWWLNGTAAINLSDNSQVIFTVTKEQNVRDIAANLKKDNLIRDPIVFFLLVKQLSLDGKIQAGDFRLSPSMTATQIAKSLTHGTLDIWVTIPEGKRATEIAEILKAKLPLYDDFWKDVLATKEGYLFPDTYLFQREATVNQVMTAMLTNFTTKYASIPPSATGLTQNQIVILASIIEREARYPQDRPLVASVLLNRLRLGMALQSDVTVEYALGYQPAEKTWWKNDLTVDDLAIQSPYNTRINTGLPPGPISNPGLASLQAAAHPATTDYLYYVSDNNGNLHYAKTLQEHNANIKKYGI